MVTSRSSMAARRGRLVQLTVKTAAAATRGRASDSGASSAKRHARGARNPARAARARRDLIGTGEGADRPPYADRPARTARAAAPTPLDATLVNEDDPP